METGLCGLGLCVRSPQQWVWTELGEGTEEEKRGLRSPCWGMSTLKEREEEEEPQSSGDRETGTLGQDVAAEGTPDSVPPITEHPPCAPAALGLQTQQQKP